MIARSLNFARLAALVAVVAAVLTPALASAAASDKPTAAASGSLVTSMTVGGATVTLGPGRLSVPQGSSFAFTSQVESAKPLSFLQARLRLLRSDGGLIYQKTFIRNSLDPTTTVFTWDRQIGDIGLAPGRYPVELGVDVQRSGESSHGALPAALYVYDPARGQLPVALVARISAQPLSDPQGRFVSDPARFVRARDSAHALADWVLNNPEAKLTLALSPVMLREWVRISAGYQLLGAEGAVDVPPSDPVALTYAATLDSLRGAVATGRLEILSEGYSDPDLFELDGADLLDDVGRQYEYGQWGILEALSATPTAGTAPPRGVPEAALTRLARSGMRYVVVPSSQARRGKEEAGGGAYKAADSPLIALVGDGAVSRSLANSSTADTLDAVFAHHLDENTSSRPLPVLVTVGPTSDVGRLIASGDALASAPWATLVTGGEAATGEPKRRVSLKGRKPDKDAPAQYWDRVSQSRRLADALLALLPAEDEAGGRAVRQSLVAAGSAWAGLDGEWGPATTGLAFAVAASDSANDVFSHLRLTASRITLAGSKGTVPVTIANGTESRLHVVVSLRPGRGVRLGGPARREVDLDPGDNFVEIPVVLENAITGEVRIDLEAGQAILASTTVPVQASYLDRLVVGGGALALLGGLLVFIIRRSKAAQATGDGGVGPGQLTLDMVDPDDRGAERRGQEGAASPQEEHAERP